MKPIEVTNLTLRDGQQSKHAGRLRQQQVLGLAQHINDMGYNSAEIDGGTRGQVPMRFLGENPWDNLKSTKEKLPSTPTQMLVRGQTLEGYKNYPDDVVREFIRTKAKNGMNIFRIFDALNDTQNLKTCVETIKELQNEGHDVTAECCISYTISDAHTTQYWAKKSQELKTMGADRICIKDMAGLLTPETARKLIPALKETGLPITLHMHATMGTAEATLLEATKLGIDKIDLSSHYMSGGSGHVSDKRFIQLVKSHESLQVRGRAPQIDIQNDAFDDLLLEAGLRNADKEVPHDPSVISKLREAGIPGGMLSTFKSQIAPQLAPHGLTWENALPALLDEIVQVRKDFGNVPLVTPTSQIVGTQAALNYMDKLNNKKILSTIASNAKTDKNTPENNAILIAQIKEPYARLTIDSQEFLMGYLGQNISPPKEELVALAEQKSGKTRIQCRPADLLENGLEKAKATLLDAVTTELTRITHKKNWIDAQTPNSQPSNAKTQHKQRLEQIIENPSTEDILLVAMFDSGNEGIESILNKASRTPNNMPQYTSPNQLPPYLTAEPSGYDHIIGDHEITSTIGRMTLEKLSQTAIELTRLEDGTISELSESSYAQYQKDIYADITEFTQHIAQQLTNSGFNIRQIYAAYQRIEKILKDRAQQLGTDNNIMDSILHTLKQEQITPPPAIPAQNIHAPS